MKPIRGPVTAVARGAALAVLFVSCREGGSGPARVPADVRSDGGGGEGTSATVGVALQVAPTFTVRDAAGNPIAGVPVTVAVTEGGGSLRDAPRRSLNGPTPIGQWTLGTRSGRNVVTVAVERVPPIQIVANGLPAAPVVVRATSGNAQGALAGTTLPSGLVVEVADAFGNGVPDMPVSFQAAAGSGAISPASAVTGADGRTSPVSWTLGRRGRAQTARATLGALGADLVANVLSEFRIEVRFLSEPSNPAVRQTFADAADRISAVVVGDIPDALLQNFNSRNCGLDFGILNETVDDLLILAEVAAIDGPGRILGQAGPCATRAVSRLPAVGIMRFDEADFQGLVTTGRLEAVVLHEMLHVVGVGSIWSLTGLLEGRGDVDPRFIGGQGIAGCASIGLGAQCVGGGVPVENTGGSGTRDSHWRESTFDAELMTGFAEAAGRDMPFTAMTLGSLEDFGLLVNYAAVDPFSVAAVSQRAAPPGAAGATDVVWEILVFPTLELGADGIARPIVVRSPESR